MALSVSIQQAAANRLSRWLSTDIPAVTEGQRWPEPDVQLPPKAVTILLAGPRLDTIYDPYVVATQFLDSQTAIYTYAIASCRQNMQLDIWATSDLERDDILARMDVAMHAGIGQTIPGSNGDPVATGLLLQLDPSQDGGWGGYVDYWFDAFQTASSPWQIREVEYRATSKGWAEFLLTVTTPPGMTIGRMTAIELRDRITDGTLGTYVPANATQVNSLGVFNYQIP